MANIDMHKKETMRIESRHEYLEYKNKYLHTKQKHKDIKPNAKLHAMYEERTETA